MKGAARAEAESGSSSSSMAVGFSDDVVVVFGPFEDESDEPEEDVLYCGKERSDGDGDDGSNVALKLLASDEARINFGRVRRGS